MIHTDNGHRRTLTVNHEPQSVTYRSLTYGPDPSNLQSKNTEHRKRTRERVILFGQVSVECLELTSQETERGRRKRERHGENDRERGRESGGNKGKINQTDRSMSILLNGIACIHVDGKIGDKVRVPFRDNTVPSHAS